MTRMEEILEAAKKQVEEGHDHFYLWLPWVANGDTTMLGQTSGPRGKVMTGGPIHTVAVFDPRKVIKFIEPLIKEHNESSP